MALLLSPPVLLGRNPDFAITGPSTPSTSLGVAAVTASSTLGVAALTASSTLGIDLRGSQVVSHLLSACQHDGNDTAEHTVTTTTAAAATTANAMVKHTAKHTPAPFRGLDDLPDELLASVFAHLASLTSRRSCLRLLPAVCKRFGSVYARLNLASHDLSWVLGCSEPYAALSVAFTRAPHMQHLSIDLKKLKLTPHTLSLPHHGTLTTSGLMEVTDVATAAASTTAASTTTDATTTTTDTAQHTDLGFCPPFCPPLRTVSLRLPQQGPSEPSDLSGGTASGNDHVLQWLAASCHATLESVDVNACSAITDAGLLALAACPKLHTLKVQKCSVSGACVLKLARSCPLLRELDVQDCTDISLADLEHVVRCRPTLANGIYTTRLDFLCSRFFASTHERERQLCAVGPAAWRGCKDLLATTRHFRQMSSTEDPVVQHDGTTTQGLIPLIQLYLDAGLAPVLLEQARIPNTCLQLETLWVLTNIASGSSEQTAALAALGCAPIVLEVVAKHVAHQQRQYRQQQPASEAAQEVIEQAVWCLANIAGESNVYRDGLVRQGYHKVLVAGLGLHLHTVTAQAAAAVPPTCSQILNGLRRLRTYSWALSNVLRGGGNRPDVVRKVLPSLLQLLQHSDEEVLMDSLWGVRYLVDQLAAAATATATEAAEGSLGGGASDAQALLAVVKPSCTAIFALAINVLGGREDNATHAPKLRHACQTVALHVISRLLEAPFSLNGIKKDGTGDGAGDGAGAEEDMSAVNKPDDSASASADGTSIDTHTDTDRGTHGGGTVGANTDAEDGAKVLPENGAARTAYAGADSAAMKALNKLLKQHVYPLLEDKKRSTRDLAHKIDASLSHVYEFDLNDFPLFVNH